MIKSKNLEGSQVLSANRLRDGAVVFLAADGDWSLDIGEAAVVDDQDAADRLTAIGAKAAAEQIVVAPYLVEVRADAAGVAPVSVRERIRAFGPTAPQIVAERRLHS